MRVTGRAAAILVLSLAAVPGAAEGQTPTMMELEAIIEIHRPGGWMGCPTGSTEWVLVFGPEFLGPLATAQVGNCPSVQALSSGPLQLPRSGADLPEDGTYRVGVRTRVVNGDWGERKYQTITIDRSGWEPERAEYAWDDPCFAPGTGQTLSSTFLGCPAIGASSGPFGESFGGSVATAVLMPGMHELCVRILDRDPSSGQIAWGPVRCQEVLIPGPPALTGATLRHPVLAQNVGGEICGNGTDDEDLDGDGVPDGDGLVDCDDPECGCLSYTASSVGLALAGPAPPSAQPGTTVLESDCVASAGLTDLPPLNRTSLGLTGFPQISYTISLGNDAPQGTVTIVPAVACTGTPGTSATTMNLTWSVPAGNPFPFTGGFEVQRVDGETLAAFLPGATSGSFLLSGPFEEELRIAGIFLPPPQFFSPIPHHVRSSLGVVSIPGFIVERTPVPGVGVILSWHDPGSTIYTGFEVIPVLCSPGPPPTPIASITITGPSSGSAYILNSSLTCCDQVFEIRGLDASGAVIACTGGIAVPCLDFRRGDANNDRQLNIGDPIFLLAYLFSGGPVPPCVDAGDANDDGGNGIDIADPISVLEYLFSGGPAPPAPFPLCGPDPTMDMLGCMGSNCP